MRWMSLFAFVAALATGCESKTENTGVPVQPNNSKNAPGAYGPPEIGKPTGPPKK